MDKYKSAKDTMIKMYGEDKIYQNTLWHGCHTRTIDKIVVQGFRKEFNKNSRYGEGTYFASDAKEARKYCTVDPTNNVHDIEYEMLLCMVLYGESCVGSRSDKLTYWPEISGMEETKTE